MGTYFTKTSNDDVPKTSNDVPKTYKEYDEIIHIEDSIDCEDKIYEIWQQQLKSDKTNIKIITNKNVLTFKYFNRNHHFSKSIDIFGPKFVIFKNCGDGHTIGTFPDAEYVLFDSCDKNFNYYSSNSKIFPNVKKVYMAGHPAEYSTRLHFPKDVWIVEKNNERYFNNWDSINNKYTDEYKTMKYDNLIKEFNELI